MKMKKLYMIFSFVLTIIISSVVYTCIPSRAASIPAIEYIHKYDIKQTSEDVIYQEINKIRAQRGLSAVTISYTVEKSALYKAMYMAQYCNEQNLPENMDLDGAFSTGFLSGQGRLEPYPFVSSECLTYVKGGSVINETSVGNYFIRSWITSSEMSKTILDPNLKFVGISVLWADTCGSGYTFAVMHTSNDANLSDAQTTMPQSVLRNDNINPEITADKIYVSLGGAITDEKVMASINYSDNECEACSVTYNLSSINTQVEGIQKLTVNITDNFNNVTSIDVDVEIVSDVYPVISGTKIILPRTGLNEVYDVSSYIIAADSLGIKGVNTIPAVVGNNSDGAAVMVKAVNLLGNVTTKIMTIEYSDVSLKQIQATGDGMLKCMSADDELIQSGHEFIDFNSSTVATGNNILYMYSFSYSDTVRYTILRKIPQLVWNPLLSGSCKIDFAVVDTTNQKILYSNSMTVTISAKQNGSLEECKANFKAASGYIDDINIGFIHGIAPTTIVSDFLSNIEIAATGYNETVYACVYQAGADNVVAGELSLGTGMRMVIRTQSEILIDKPIVIYGDITGEGYITIADYAKLRQVILENLSLEGAFFEAANITRKTDVGGTIADYAMLRQYILENANIIQ